MSLWIGPARGPKLLRYLRDEARGLENTAVLNCTLLGRASKRARVYGREATQAVWDNFRRGFSPDGKTRLVRNAGSRKRQEAWLAVLGVAKPVSVLLTILPPAE